MSDAFLGEVRLWASPRIPDGWQVCDGSLLSLAEYQALFSLLGTTYGGDGRNTFGVPDLRGRAPIHQGFGTNLTPRILGQMGGEPMVNLTAAQIPTHTHQVLASTEKGKTNLPTTNNDTGANVLAAGKENLFLYMKEASAGRDFTFDGGSLTSSGGNQSHSNMMASFALNFIICLRGDYPTRDY